MDKCYGSYLKIIRLYVVGLHGQTCGATSNLLTELYCIKICGCTTTMQATGGIFLSCIIHRLNVKKSFTLNTRWNE